MLLWTIDFKFILTMCIISSIKPGHYRSVTCAICMKVISFAEATTGLLDAEGNQTFACDSHFWRGHEYVTGWVNFSISEQAKLLGRGELTPSGIPIKEWEDDWTLY